ncbi:MAG: class F sortase, partial [Actinomycetota bacterium]|nr:class F sortase [Actinomycetota bacterium]
MPNNVDQLGWWSSGAAPGSSSGTVDIDGHVDSAVQGTGEFFNLEKSTPGDIVVLSTSDGDVRYRVVARAAYKKADLPREIFSLTGRPRLILITCGGSFDKARHNYADN